MRAILLGALWVTAIAAGWAESEERITKEQALVSFQSLRGKTHRPLTVADGQKATVLIFSTVDCPVANAYQPRLQQIASDYEKQGVSFFLVHVDPAVDEKAATSHAEEYKVEMPILLDSKHALVEATGATITPEAVVIAKNGAILYRGRIDDWYTKLGSRRAAPRNHDLRNALDQILAGDPVKESRTEAIGCIIADFRPSEDPSGTKAKAPSAIPPSPSGDTPPAEEPNLPSPRSE